ncbi:rust resistance kinase Lr10-like [Coffea arabica]|uniref:Rust resistance kinase Lr10-like n=1 Tax=Coffea arabica TaxID=13443 RepID=A0A6P6XDD5_COFAR|nr:rust resistance kinase Lr10-like [Coffea arabica]
MSKQSFCISLLLLFCLVVQSSSSRAQSSIHSPDSCIPSSCGNLHNISYPFRLKGDPKNCGDPSYELDCQNNRTILTLNSKKFHVQAITYENFTIRAVDPGVDNNDSCSFPTYSSFDYLDLPISVYDKLYDYNIPVVYINCLKPVNASRYMENTFCRNGSSSAFSNSSRVHRYIAVGEDFRISDLEESCGVEMSTKVSKFGPMKDIHITTSLASVHELLAYGFELSWFRVLCQECEADHHGFCSVENNTVTCRHYCYENEPLSELPLRCTLEYWGTIIGLYALISVGSLLGLRFVCGITCLAVLVVFKWRRRHLSADETIEEFLQSQTSLMPIKYSYCEIRKMTGNFREKLGEGSCGSVYKGKLRSGPFVAVKIMENTTTSELEFVSKVATMGRIHHVNVVQLVGFCTEGSKRALVYEFMPNGSLDKYSFPKGQSQSVSLSYEKVFEIALGVARGIHYLHRGCDMRILHFGIKPHNILLDENYNPKISDFGLAQLYPNNESFISLPAARGTMGYTAPELFYKNIGGVSYKADVYSFGMLLMEMASRRENRNPGAEHVSQIYFTSWAYDRLQAGQDIDMAFANAEERKMILVALWCIQMKPDDRPAMNKIVEMLEGDADLVPMPPKPFLAPREMAEEFETITSSRGSLAISIESRD